MMHVPVRWLRRIHATFAAVWLALSIPSMIWWKNSIPYLIFLSVYAIVAAHAAAWAGARAEESNGGGDQ